MLGNMGLLGEFEVEADVDAVGDLVLASSLSSTIVLRSFRIAS